MQDRDFPHIVRQYGENPPILAVGSYTYLIHSFIFRLVNRFLIKISVVSAGDFLFKFA